MNLFTAILYLANTESIIAFYIQFNVTFMIIFLLNDIAGYFLSSLK